MDSCTLVLTKRRLACSRISISGKISGERECDYIFERYNERRDSKMRGEKVAGEGEEREEGQ